MASDRVVVKYEMPFNEVVLDFYDRLKTVSRGYASLDYHVSGYWESPLVKLDILVNGDPVDALSIIVHEESSYARGRALASKMRELIPRQMFEVAIQAAICSRIIARESVRAVEWMAMALDSPYWQTANLPRIRDVIDQRIGQLRRTMQSAEESWVRQPANAWRRQNNPALLTAGNFLTQTYYAYRLRWMLSDPATKTGTAISTDVEIRTRLSKNLSLRRPERTPMEMPTPG